MTTKELVAYVNDQRRQGVSESQIARKLGMSLAHFLGKMNAIEKEHNRHSEVIKATTVKPKDIVKTDDEPKKTEEHVSQITTEKDVEVD